MAGDPGAPAPGEGGGGQAVGRQQVPGLGWLGEDAPDYSSEDDNILHARLEILQSRPIGFLHKDCGDGGLRILLQCSMTQLVRFFVLGMLTGCLALHAQNFSGSDDFSGVTGNWSADTTANGGTLTVAGGVLNFTDGGLLASSNSSAYRDWTLNAGSYTADWQAQIDFTFNSLSQVPSQITGLTFIVANISDLTDNARLSFQQSYMMSATRAVSGSVYTSGTPGTDTGWISTTATTVTVRASYLASSHELSLAYNDGTGFTNVFTSTTEAGGLAWEMSDGDTFGLRIAASNLTNAGASSAIILGNVYADNFAASSTAPIPEPSTYAAGLGALALLVAGLKRRFGQQ